MRAYFDKIKKEINVQSIYCCYRSQIQGNLIALLVTEFKGGKVLSDIELDQFNSEGVSTWLLIVNLRSLDLEAFDQTDKDRNTKEFDILFEYGFIVLKSLSSGKSILDCCLVVYSLKEIVSKESILPELNPVCVFHSS